VFDPGADGFDFILKVNATIKDRNGKVWPDYQLSEFGRKPHAIANTDKEIDAIMNSTVDLDEYLQGMERDEEDVIEALKTMMVWDLVGSEWKKAKGVQKELAEDDIPNFEEAPDKSVTPSKMDVVDTEPTVTKTVSEPIADVDDDLSDEELMKELEGL
jgi:hypothetical protein